MQTSQCPTVSILRLFLKLLYHILVRYMAKIVYNVHGLVHLPVDVQQFSCLDRISAFPYENHLQKIKRLVRKPDGPFTQSIRRLLEQTSFGASGATTDGASGVASSSLKKQHLDGLISERLDVKG